MSKSWDFPVKTYPIVVHRQGEYLTFPKRIAVVREDSRKPIAIASDRYGLLLHKDVVKTFREAFGPKEEINETFKMSKDGARMHYEVVLPNILVEVSPGDKMAMRLIVENSYDSSHRLQVTFGAFRLVCENGLVIGRKFLSISRKHIGEMSLSVENIQKQVGILTMAFKDSEKEMKKMVATPLRETYSSPEDFFDAKRIHIPAYLTKIAADSYAQNNGESSWDAYNALTWAITHHMKRDNPETQITHGRKAWAAAVALLK